MSYFEAGIDESIKRTESFKNRMVLKMRMGSEITDGQYEFACKMVDAVVVLLKGHRGPLVKP